jgi:hypothetical protein
MIKIGLINISSEELLVFVQIVKWNFVKVKIRFYFELNRLFENNSFQKNIVASTKHFLCKNSVLSH